MDRYTDHALALVETVLLARLGQHRPWEGQPLERDQQELGLDQVLVRFEARYGRLRWIRGAGRSRELFLRRLSEVLRHRSRAALILARRVTEEAIDHGLDQILSGTSREAARFLSLAREVREHLRQLISETLLVSDGAALLAYLEPEHRVGDLLALELSRRHPGREILLATPELCYQLSSGRLLTVTDPNLCRVLRHRVLSVGEAERYWAEATVRSRA